MSVPPTSRPEKTAIVAGLLQTGQSVLLNEKANREAAVRTEGAVAARRNAV